MVLSVVCQVKHRHESSHNTGIWCGLPLSFRSGGSLVANSLGKRSKRLKRPTLKGVISRTITSPMANPPARFD